jgi:hypothetical protein
MPTKGNAGPERPGLQDSTVKPPMQQKSATVGKNPPQSAKENLKLWFYFGKRQFGIMHLT